MITLQQNSYCNASTVGRRHCSSHIGKKMGRVWYCEEDAERHNHISLKMVDVKITWYWPQNFSLWTCIILWLEKDRKAVSSLLTSSEENLSKLGLLSSDWLHSWAICTALADHHPKWLESMAVNTASETIKKKLKLMPTTLCNQDYSYLIYAMSWRKQR